MNEKAAFARLGSQKTYQRVVCGLIARDGCRVVFPAVARFRFDSSHAAGNVAAPIALGLSAMAFVAPNRRALTLVELLVVIAIIGTLVALLLPAVQAARESARRASCQNNLRQLGIALQSHHNDLGALPVGCVEWRPWRGTDERQLAWSVYLLPYLEQQSLYDGLNLTKPFDDPANADAAATLLPEFVCPSSQRAEQTNSPRGPSDYGGMYGERITSPNNPPKGTMLIDTAISFRQITDGTSKTIVVAEDSGFGDGEWINGRNIFDQAFAINAAPSFENDMRSEHPGGAHCVLADGSVRFLSDALYLNVLAALCTRAEGETTDGY